MPTATRPIRPPNHLRSHFTFVVAPPPADSFQLDLGDGLPPSCEAGWFSLLVSQALVDQVPGSRGLLDAPSAPSDPLAALFRDGSALDDPPPLFPLAPAAAGIRLQALIPVLSSGNPFSAADRSRAHPSALVIHPSSPTDLEFAQRYLASLQFHQLPEPEAAAAWLRFYAGHDPHIRRTVLACRIVRAHVDDCVQEVWLELALKLPLFVLDPARGTFAAWLRRVTRRKAVEYRRRWSRFGRLRFDASYNLARLCCPRLPEPAHAAELNELRQRVREVLAEFEQRESRLNWLILHSCTVKGRSAEETARRLKVPVKRVGERHCRTRRRLRSFLQQRLGLVG